MKRSLKTKLLTILLSLAMLFTMMPITTNTINAADEIELTVGAEYKYEDKIKISQDAYILIDEKLDAKRQVEANTYIFEKVTIRHNYVGEYLTVLYAVSNPSEVAFSLYLGHNKGYTGSLEERSRIIGIKCVGGDGTQSNPYKFDLLLTDKVIEVGTVFAKGETISFPKDAYILGDDKFSNIKQQVITGEYTVGDFTWIADNGQYSCDTNFKLASGTLDLRLGYGKGYTGSDEEKASIIGVKCISGTGYYSDPYTFAIEFASPTTTHTVTYKIVNGTWSDGKNNPITEDVLEGQTPSNIPTGMKPISDENLVGSWDKDPSKTSITGNTEFIYTFPASDAMILTVTPYEGDYDGNLHCPLASANVDDALIQYSTDGTNWSITVPMLKDVGTTEVTVKATARGYVEKTATSRLTINPKPITITTGSASKQYDGMPLTNDEAEISGLVNGETATVIAIGSQMEIGSSTNTYSIDWGTTKASNYDITENLGTLTVSGNTTEITLIAASGSKIYDGTPLTNSNVTVTGLPIGFTVDNVTMTAESTITDVGTKANVIDSYVIRDSAGIDKTVNFINVRKVAGTLEIMRKNVTVKADNKTKTFGDADPELTATVDGLIQGDESLLKYTLSREPVEVVGVHEIRATGEEEQGNYKVSYESGTFTITPTTYTVTYKVVNGTLSDGTSTSTTETVEHGKTPSSIPTNLIPKQGYEAGSWDVDPTTASIIERTTFTYTFVKKKYDVTYKIVNGKWSDGKTDPIKVSVEHGDSPTQIPTGMEPISDEYENGSWNIDPSTVASVTGNTEFTYTFVKKADPTVITYKNTAGNNGTWTKGDTKTLDFTFKRTPDGDRTVYESSFDHIEVDGKTIDKSNYEIGYGSIIIKLLPSYLDTLSVNTTHTLKIVFDDGSVTTNFTIKEKGNNNNNNNNNNNKSYYIPKTGVE